MSNVCILFQSRLFIYVMPSRDYFISFHLDVHYFLRFINTFLASSNFCFPLLAFANSLQQNVGPDLDTDFFSQDCSYMLCHLVTTLYLFIWIFIISLVLLTLFLPAATFVFRCWPLQTVCNKTSVLIWIQTFRHCLIVFLYMCKSF